jgi:hemoglobin-like flavoprotein
MSLTASQIEQVQKSFENLRYRGEPASFEMYERLFARAPHLKPMFRDDLAGQGMKFINTLGFIVDNLSNPADVKARLDELGAGHATLGVKAEHFNLMGEALMVTLAHVLGDEFTPEVETAWRQAYQEVADAVIEHGNIQSETA